MKTDRQIYETPRLIVGAFSAENGFAASDVYGGTNEAGKTIIDENFGEF